MTGARDEGGIVTRGWKLLRCAREAEMSSGRACDQTRKETEQRASRKALWERSRMCVAKGRMGLWSQWDDRCSGTCRKAACLEWVESYPGSQKAGRENTTPRGNLYSAEWERRKGGDVSDEPGGSARAMAPLGGKQWEPVCLTNGRTVGVGEVLGKKQARSILNTPWKEVNLAPCLGPSDQHLLTCLYCIFMSVEKVTKL